MRETRTALAQLRSGYSVRLNSYLSRIADTIVDECPDCGEAGHTTAHLFNCPARPTSLGPEALWESPIEAAAHLGLDDRLLGLAEEEDEGGGEEDPQDLD